LTKDRTFLSTETLIARVLHGKKYSTSSLLDIRCLLGALLLGTFSLQAKDAPKLPPPADKENVTYAKDIRPLFERSCFKCHGEEKQKGKLRLDSLEAVLKGADGEQVITPGNSAKSKLVKAVAHATEDEDEWMPPPEKAKELTPEEVGLVRAWIDQGAK